MIFFLPKMHKLVTEIKTRKDNKLKWKTRARETARGNKIT